MKFVTLPSGCSIPLHKVSILSKYMFDGYKTHHTASELQRKCCNERSIEREGERVRKSVHVERERAPAKAGFAQAEADKHLHACKHKPPPTTTQYTHSLTLTFSYLR